LAWTKSWLQGFTSQGSKSARLQPPPPVNTDHPQYLHYHQASYEPRHNWFPQFHASKWEPHHRWKITNNTTQNILLIYRKKNNSSFTGLLDTHNLSAHAEMTPNPTHTQAQHTDLAHTTPTPRHRSAAHYRHPITNNLIRRPPSTHRLTAGNEHTTQTSVPEPCSEPQTSPTPAILIAETLSEIQERATQTYLHHHQ
jgi:hypothetical protein